MKEETGLDVTSPLRIPGRKTHVAWVNDMFSGEKQFLCIFVICHLVDDGDEPEVSTTVVDGQDS